jgi:vesicle-fusing ATPase
MPCIKNAKLRHIVIGLLVLGLLQPPAAPLLVAVESFSFSSRSIFLTTNNKEHSTRQPFSFSSQSNQNCGHLGTKSSIILKAAESPSPAGTLEDAADVDAPVNGATQPLESSESSSLTVNGNGNDGTEGHQISTNTAKNDVEASKMSTTSSDKSTILTSTTSSSSESENDDDDDDAFEAVCALATLCLLESDRSTNQDNGSKTPHNWIDGRASSLLQTALNHLEVKLPHQRQNLDRDDAATWLKWLKAIPSPVVVDLTSELSRIANTALHNNAYGKSLSPVEQQSLLRRLDCKLYLFPSGAALQQPIHSPGSSLVYGKLLYGGVRRFRLLSSRQSSGGNAGRANRVQRRGSERTALKSSPKDRIPAWVQYGGADRNYEAVDMGAAAVLELSLLPTIITNTFSSNGNGAAGNNDNHQKVTDDMSISQFGWDPHNMFHFASDADDEDDSNGNVNNNNNQQQDEIVVDLSLNGRDRNEAFESSFKSRVGGLSKEIDAIVRRVLDGRVIRPADETVAGESTNDAGYDLNQAAREAEALRELGLFPVKGLLLYGPPGCGKTQLAREISRALRARAPKIVAAPELLDRWVGGSEKLVRELFGDAEAELAACGGDSSKSALHVVVIDEIDAVFRKRSSNADDSGEATRSSTVNQILSKLDGVSQISNILLIGMTNRRELLDDALLRPGRLEVQIEIPLPSMDGRREILQIHFAQLRYNGRLSRPLCQAMDGVMAGETEERASSNNNDNGKGGSTLSSSKKRKRDAVKHAWNRAARIVPLRFKIRHGERFVDLAADKYTAGYSGADLAGLVRCAGSIALGRARQNGNGVEGLLITLEDVLLALEEVKN